MIELTNWARDILTRAAEAATRFNPDARIRLARTLQGVQALLTDEPQPDDQILTFDSTTVFVERGLEGLVDVEEPHDRLVLRPTGSTPNERAAH